MYISVLIIVNVASKCGYTAKHYAELNELYDQYAESKGKSSVAKISFIYSYRISFGSFCNIKVEFNFAWVKRPVERRGRWWSLKCSVNFIP